MIMRGDRVGLIGPNGSGKTTLLRLLLGDLPPQAGTVRHGTNLEVAYFDQLHAQLDETKSVRENVRDGSDSVTVNGRTRHIIGYLEDFLFTPEQAGSPVARLSGGERNRLAVGPAFHQAVQRAGHGRTDQRPGPGDARTAGRPVERVCRHAAVGQSRPRVSQQRGDQHAGPRRRGPGQGICGRLRRLAAAAAGRAAAGRQACRRPAGADSNRRRSEPGV